MAKAGIVGSEQSFPMMLAFLLGPEMNVGYSTCAQCPYFPLCLGKRWRMTVDWAPALIWETQMKI